jgi:cytochrome P450
LNPDFTFSDGTFIKQGTRVWAGASTAHYDNEYYPDADEFDGFRFANMREAGEGASDGFNLRHHMVTTSATYLPFGHGEAYHSFRWYRILTYPQGVMHVQADSSQSLQ